MEKTLHFEEKSKAKKWKELRMCAVVCGWVSGVSIRFFIQFEALMWTSSETIYKRDVRPEHTLKWSYIVLFVLYVTLMFYKFNKANIIMDLVYYVLHQSGSQHLGRCPPPSNLCWYEVFMQPFLPHLRGFSLSRNNHTRRNIMWKKKQKTTKPLCGKVHLIRDLKTFSQHSLYHLCSPSVDTLLGCKEG